VLCNSYAVTEPNPHVPPPRSIRRVTHCYTSVTNLEMMHRFGIGSITRHKGLHLQFFELMHRHQQGAKKGNLEGRDYGCEETEGQIERRSGTDASSSRLTKRREDSLTYERVGQRGWLECIGAGASAKRERERGGRRNQPGLMHRRRGIR
jgi:hypothetical protein